MKHELTYKLPYEQVVKLCRTGRRKTFKATRRIFLVLIAIAAAIGIAFSLFLDALNKWMENTGIQLELVDMIIIIALLFGISNYFVMKKIMTTQVKSRVDYSQDFKLFFEDNGLRIVTTEIEYLVKWQGIHQLFVVRDGIMVLAGNLLFAVPNVAFPTLEEKRTFLQDVYSRLSEKARSLSEKEVRAVIGQGTS